MSSSYKSSRVFNLEERKRQTGKPVTEVEIFQWKSVLLEELRKNTNFSTLLVPAAEWKSPKSENRGFTGDDAQTTAKCVDDMLTKISSLAPSCLVRAIINRTNCLQDIWNLIYEWAGIQTTGSKHLDYYRIKKSWSPSSDETKQEFFYRLRDAMEDTLLSSDTSVLEFGKAITDDEDMSPCINSLVVMDWIDTIGGSTLVEHIFRVYAKDLETSTLGSLQGRISKNLDSLMHEIEEQQVAHANRTEVLHKLHNLEKVSRPHNTFKQNQKSQSTLSSRSQNVRSPSRYCKLCQRAGNHTLAYCPQLSPSDRSQIAKVRHVTSTLDDMSIQEESSDNEVDNEYLDTEASTHETGSD